VCTPDAKSGCSMTVKATGAGLLYLQYACFVPNGSQITSISIMSMARPCRGRILATLCAFPKAARISTGAPSPRFCRLVQEQTLFRTLRPLLPRIHFSMRFGSFNSNTASKQLRGVAVVVAGNANHVRAVIPVSTTAFVDLTVRVRCSTCPLHAVLGNEALPFVLLLAISVPVCHSGCPKATSHVGSTHC